MQATDSYYQLRELQIDSIIHPDWGINDFRRLKPTIESLTWMMLRMGADIESIPEIPTSLAEKGNQIIDSFYTAISGLKNFDIESSRETGFKSLDAFKRTAEKLFNDYLTAGNGHDPNSEMFLSVYNAIISFEANAELRQLNSQYFGLLKEWADKKVEFSDQSAKLDDAQKSYQNLIDLLENTAKEKTTEDYAEIFKKEASLNNSSSKLWLTVSIIAFLLFFIFIKFESDIINIDTTTNATVTTIEYLKRLLIISFFIYIITFLIKQYSIKKHLETLNTHRQNTLNSYNLFLKSMGTADQDVKNALMVEVARAIYESGQTGYINSKDDNSNSSSIMEVTKFIKPNP